MLVIPKILDQLFQFFDVIDQDSDEAYQRWQEN